MSDDFGNDIITISDEDGNVYTLEHLDTLEVDGTFYMACVTADVEEDDERYGIVILAVAGDDELAEVEDKDLLNSLYDMFMERLFSDEDTDEEYEEYEEDD